MSIKYLIIILGLFILVELKTTYDEKKLKRRIVTNCQVSNYCEGDNPNGNKVGCSTYGNCNFNLYEYFNSNSSNNGKKAKCVCNLGYSSYDVDIGYESTTKCCYKQRSQMTGFLLEIFLGFGIGNFYLGDNVMGVLRLTISIGLCVLLWCTTYFACNRDDSGFKEVDLNNDQDKDGNKKNKKDDGDSLFSRCPKSMFIIYFCVFGFFLFSSVDFFMIGLGAVKDENGEKPYMW